ncbi:hypothetical protein D3C71_1452820 [compost metagenome]
MQQPTRKLIRLHVSHARIGNRNIQIRYEQGFNDKLIINGNAHRVAVDQHKIGDMHPSLN